MTKSTPPPWASPTLTVSTRFGEIAYTDIGSGEPLVLVHGLGGDFTHFAHFGEELKGRYRVVAIDMPGCGASEKPERRHSIEDYADTLLEVMTKIDLEHAVLVGHSAGGQVCATAAAKAPRRVRRLVLLNPSGLRGYSRPVRAFLRLLVRERLLRYLLRANVNRILKHVFEADNVYTREFIDRHTGERGDRRKDLLPHVAKVFHDLVPELLRSGIVDRAAQLTMPVLVVWGDRDRLVPLQRVREAARSIPTANLEVVPGCGHMPMIEAPGHVANLVHEFLVA